MEGVVEKKCQVHTLNVQKRKFIYTICMLV